MIAILNLGSGNIGSIVNALNWLGIKNIISDDPNKLLKAERIIIPGVGAHNTAMSKIREAKLKETLQQAALVEKKPILGICLGMQILTSQSEEGHEPGLNWIKGEVIKIKSSEKQKVPNMGWLPVVKAKDCPIMKGITDRTKFYFAHSYIVKTEKEQSKFLSTKINSDDFACGITTHNTFGVQFHPEKSHEQGLNLLKNFAKL